MSLINSQNALLSLSSMVSPFLRCLGPWIASSKRWSKVQGCLPSVG
ncbi:hypothetical protein VD0002_g3608 [Verticillium dahliae]|uniref:Uncharacterized protein n=1 Tax=Verticillium dahliae TaxID=27337 RepID=A0AA44WMA0_VERDA|nr:hypothetical protein BJF96_g4660 [Verticillium dahliae]PNH52161.1 hypothetical protein VD0003_g5145 [Verticillium dahliae]PNH65374.1 hypothetical protein VD0002_g3608 [Verticillium dahliae]